jgi:hypothetical protein
VAGLGWADRARRAAARLTAPAALSAVGITALGGLVLSPFGVLPQQGGTTYRPATAVVTTPALDAATHVTRVVAPAAPAKAATSTSVDGTGHLSGLAHKVNKSTPCINDSDSDDGHDATLTLPATEPDPSAGSSSCDGFESTPGSTVWLTPTLPDNPTGVRQIGITSSDIQCSAVAGAPLVSCSPDKTQPGAPK